MSIPPEVENELFRGLYRHAVENGFQEPVDEMLRDFTKSWPQSNVGMDTSLRDEMVKVLRPRGLNHIAAQDVAQELLPAVRRHTLTFFLAFTWAYERPSPGMTTGDWAALVAAAWVPLVTLEVVHAWWGWIVSPKSG